MKTIWMHIMLGENNHICQDLLPQPTYKNKDKQEGFNLLPPKYIEI